MEMLLRCGIGIMLWWQPVDLDCRYYLKVLVHRKISDNVKELMLWCPADEDVEAEILEETPIDLEVGLEEFLHLKLSIDRST